MGHPANGGIDPDPTPPTEDFSGDVIEVSATSTDVATDDSTSGWLGRALLPRINIGCSSALRAAKRTAGGVARANAAWSVLQGAANSHNIPTSFLASIGVRETDFRNVQENGGSGMGVFQLTNQPGVSTAQAFNLPFAANYAANMLSSNMSYLSNKFPSFTAPQLLQATAASYNFGTGK